MEREAEVWKRLRDSRLGGVYEVSNQGRIRRVRCSSCGQDLQVKLLRSRKRVTGKRGRPVLDVTLQHQKVKVTVQVHRAVAEAFVANPNGYAFVDFKDGNSLNCRVENLEWVIQPKNHPKARKIEDKQVPQVRALFEDGLTCTEIGAAFGCSASVVSRALNRQIYGRAA